MTTLKRIVPQTQVEKLRSIIPGGVAYTFESDMNGNIITLITENQRLIDFAVSKGMVIQ